MTRLAALLTLVSTVPIGVATHMLVNDEMHPIPMILLLSSGFVLLIAATHAGDAR